VPNSTSPASTAGTAAWAGIPRRPPARHSRCRSPYGSAAASCTSRRVWSGQAPSCRVKLSGIRSASGAAPGRPNPPASSTGLVFSTRTPRQELAAVPELLLDGLPTADARMLLESTLARPLDARVRDQIVRETGGNPLALLELLRGLTRTQLAGGFGLPGAVSVSARIEESFARQLAALPEQTQRLLQLAAADPSGDADLVGRSPPRPCCARRWRPFPRPRWRPRTTCS